VSHMARKRIENPWNGFMVSRLCYMKTRGVCDE
jgi:hypothetical protein